MVKGLRKKEKKGGMVMKASVKITAVLLVLLLAMSSMAAAASVAEKRQSVRDMANNTLDRLYQVHPSAQAAIESAEGYAVFSNYGVKFLLLGGGKGKGLAVNNRSGEEVFMKMVEVQAGFGLGVKKFSMVFVFETENAFERFVNSGWEFGGQVTAAATDGVNGDSFQGAVPVSSGIWVYQLTDKGLAVELTGKGTKYYKDSDLN
jgi:lipid-binding SYLF domain-containing protein